MRVYQNTRRTRFGEEPSVAAASPLPITPTTDPRSDVTLPPTTADQPSDARPPEADVVPAVAASPAAEFVADATPDPKPVISYMEPGIYKLKDGFRLVVSEEAVTIDRQSAAGNRLSAGTVKLGNDAAGVIISFATIGSTESEALESVAETQTPPTSEPDQAKTAPEEGAASNGAA